MLAADPCLPYDRGIIRSTFLAENKTVYEGRGSSLTPLPLLETPFRWEKYLEI